MHSSRTRTCRLLALSPSMHCSPVRCLLLVDLLLELGVVSQHALRQTPSPPVDRMTDTCKNITFAKFAGGS